MPPTRDRGDRDTTPLQFSPELILHEKWKYCKPTTLLLSCSILSRSLYFFRKFQAKDQKHMNLCEVTLRPSVAMRCPVWRAPSQRRRRVRRRRRAPL